METDVATGILADVHHIAREQNALPGPALITITTDFFTSNRTAIRAAATFAGIEAVYEQQQRAN